MNKAVIFDLDGTLWDSTGCSCAIWNRVLEKYTDTDVRVTREQVASLMGKTMTEIGRILFPDTDAGRRQEITDRFADEENIYLSEHGATLYGGLVETLQELSVYYDLYIVSNSQDGYVQAFLRAHRLGMYFTDFEMSGRTGMDKGHNVRLVMERNRIEKAVFVGDTAGDEQAARFAGIPFIHAAYGFGKAQAPDRAIAGIRELPAAAREMLERQ